MAQKMSWSQVVIVAMVLSIFIYYMTKDKSSVSFSSSKLGGHLTPDAGKLHVLLTGGAGFIGSHASMRLLQEGHAVTTIDNLSRGNRGAVKIVDNEAKGNRYRFVEADLGDKEAVCAVMHNSNIDLVMHFAAIAYVGESMAEPLRYYHNVTSNTITILECMMENDIKRLVYSSTCATYGNPETLPVTEETPPRPINPYGKSKLMAEEAIRDYAVANHDLKVIIFRYFNVYGSDPEGRLGEYPRPDLRRHARISGACLDAAMGLIDSLTIMGTKHPTKDGTCVRDFIHVTDLVDAHVKGMDHLANPPNLYNIGTGNGISVREFVEACKKVTGADIKVVEQQEARPGDYAAVYSDVTKIETEMNWKAQYTNVEESLGHAWKWRQAHPNGYDP